LTLYSSAVVDGRPIRADSTLQTVVERALSAYAELAELGEGVADEWQYVNDLLAVHSADLRAIASAAPDRLVPPAAVGAVDLAIEEIRLIADPHRAIDWLSTFPQIVRVALTSPGSA
jgi:hypothetical protein